jgi:1,2-phenylacetyl-CoA epoxidase catalytic subunit
VIATSAADLDAAAGAAMSSLIASLADNKAALGTRYGEWAVSAPTLESAVAAAAMAQDELGHARSTYPVLRALGIEPDEEAGGDRRLAVLDTELPDWTAFVAANILIDGVLTTYVAACTGSSLTQMAQRARKILHEERSHKLHAEAWTRRLCRSGERQRDHLVDWLREMWEQAGRWPGPPGDPGVTAALARGMLKVDAPAQREQVRRWLTDLLRREGVPIELPEPTDWSAWNPHRRRWEP